MTTILTKTDCDQVRTTHTVDDAVVFTFSGDSGGGVTIFFNGSEVGYLTKKNPQYEAKALGEYTLVSNTGCANVSVDVSSLSSEGDFPLTIDCESQEALRVHDECARTRLSSMIDLLSDILTATITSTGGGAPSPTQDNCDGDESLRVFDPCSITKLEEIVDANMEVVNSLPLRNNCRGGRSLAVYDSCNYSRLNTIAIRIRNLIRVNNRILSAINNTSDDEQDILNDILAAILAGNEAPPDEEEFIYTGNRVAFRDPRVYSREFGVGMAWYDLDNGGYTSIDQVIKRIHKTNGSILEEIEYIATQADGTVSPYSLKRDDVVLKSDYTAPRSLRSAVVNIEPSDGLTTILAFLNDRPNKTPAHIKSMTMELINKDPKNFPPNGYGYALIHADNVDPRRDRINIGYKHRIDVSEYDMYTDFNDLSFQAFDDAQWTITVTYEVIE